MEAKKNTPMEYLKIDDCKANVPFQKIFEGVISEKESNIKR